MDEDYLETKKPGAGRGIAGLVFVTVSALLMALAVALLPWVAGELEGGVTLNPWTTFIGDLHPMILHLPIGIFVLIFVMELVGWCTLGKWKPRTVFALFLGVVTAVVSVVCGYFLFLQGDRSGEEVFNHLWSSIAFTVIATLAFVAKVWAEYSGGRSPIYGILLILAVGTLGYAGHIGGEMTHHDPFEALISALETDEARPEEVREHAVVAAAKPVEELLAYEEVVVPILEAKCYQCHADADKNPTGKKKIKGKLVMTSLEDLKKGGSSDEPAVAPGSLEDSYMIYSISLPLDDDEHMPPEDKPQLEAHEIEILKWWILAGAPAGRTMKEAGATEEIIAAAGRLQSPEELKAQADADAAAEAAAKAEAEARKKKLEEAIAKVSGEFPNALRFVSQESSDLTFTAVSMREDFGDADLAKLVPVGSGLVELEIGATSVTDAASESLKAMPNLRRLKLNETGVTDVVLEVVAGMKELEYLNLVGTAVTDEGIKQLAGMPKLRKLYLWRSEVTKEGAAALEESLPGCEINLGWE